MAYKAIVAGATGLVGSCLLDILLEHPAYDEVVILVRKQLRLKHKKLIQVVIDFDQLNQYQSIINGHALFCCLGSTRKKTPDLSVYRKIDFDYPLQFAKMVLANKVSQYHLISALGANAGSSNFYSKMKGEVEQSIEKVGLPCLHIYQPSLLVGNRKEFRLTEQIATVVMKVLDPLLMGSLKKYRSIKAQTVAMAMVKQSLQNQEGIFIHPSDHIKQLA